MICQTSFLEKVIQMMEKFVSDEQLLRQCGLFVVGLIVKGKLLFRKSSKLYIRKIKFQSLILEFFIRTVSFYIKIIIY
jgi:hypothetical protein